MATVNIDPVSTVSSDWATQGGGDAHVELGNFAFGSNSITSVRHYIRGYKWNTRSGTTDVQVILENSSGAALYTEDHTLAVNGYDPQNFYGTARAYSSGTTDWVESDITGLRLNINTSPEDPDGNSRARVVKAYVEVTYTAAVQADNATFFGTNF